MRELEKLRQELVAIDQELLEQFLRRMQTIDRIAECKEKTQGKVFDPEQEAKVIRRTEANTTPRFKPYAGVFVRTLMRLSRERQYELLVNWGRAPIQVLPENQARQDRVKILGLPCDLGSSGIQAAQALYPEATLVHTEDAGSACRQVAEGSIDCAIVPLTGELFSLLKKHALYIQARLSLSADYVAVGSELIVPFDVQSVHFLIQIGSMEALPLVIHILGDLGLTLAQIQSLQDASICVEFCADPTSPRTRQALYHIQQEAGEMRPLGCYGLPISEH